MGKTFEFFKTTLIGGVLIIAPAAALVLLLVKVAQFLRHLLDPLVRTLPGWIPFPYVTEVIAVIALCFLAGLIVRTTLGRWFGARIERHVFERIPGYALFKAVTGQSLGGAMGEGAVPALVSMEDGLVPGLIIEKHDDGYVTVFVPSPPAPTSGQCYVFATEMVHPVDVTLPKFLSCITKWGLGAQELRLAMKQP